MPEAAAFQVNVALGPESVLPGVGLIKTGGNAAIPVPFNRMLCVEPLTFSALSVNTSVPLNEPNDVGEKLMITGTL